ncbi:PTS sugar transporter subunit IIA [Terrilactibacillus tamarindi]|uniref:PTS sugar transporter subunit IIA n=1 Tax=Terrilactibacillus tamarindi TaxID=2599694 RepID=UPI002E2F130D|nr:PTS glucose transporter subunit IIA [Terrilactibacillus tamarindi]
MFNKLFKGKNKEKHADIKSKSFQFIYPLEGKVIPIEDVPDPVFSQKMMGEGFAIEPTNNMVKSPVDGEVISVFPTKHAVSLKDHIGNEILIHVGLDTVTLKGKGFKSFVKSGQSVKQGDKLLEVDFEFLKDKVPSIVTPVIITNLQDEQKVVTKEDHVEIG